jgi:reactive intermediate/imine deaminase
MYSKAIMGIITIAAVSLLFFCQCEPAPDTAPEVEYLNTGKKTGAPFSKAVRVGHMLYLSGELGIDPKTGKLASGGIAADTKQAMKNIKNTLEEFGSSLDRVVKCTVMLADINEWQEMNAVYVTFFPKHLPARSAFGTSGLAMGARLEIECWATVD